MPPVSAAQPFGARVDDARLACDVLDGDATLLDPDETASVIGRVLAGTLQEIARDRNGVCFRAPLRYAGAPVTAIIKAARPGPQRSNPDLTFGWEARVLGSLPPLGIGSAPVLFARIAAAGQFFLITSELPGHHPHPRAHPFRTAQFDAVLDELHALDTCGLMHYDLKTANILTHEHRAGFIDFEFARFEKTRSPKGRASNFCADFNVSSNRFLPGRSNVANFEFRTLHHYLADLEATDRGVSGDVMRTWLAAKSCHHQRLAVHLERCGSERGLVADATVSVGPARNRAAVAYERELGGLFAQPCASTLQVERSVMGFRCAVFERRDEEARCWRALADAGLSEGASAGLLPTSYCDSISRVLALVGRSKHPDDHAGRATAQSRCDGRANDRS